MTYAAVINLETDLLVDELVEPREYACAKLVNLPDSFSVLLAQIVACSDELVVQTHVVACEDEHERECKEVSQSPPESCKYP